MFSSWFQRQQTCPTCRLNILRAPITTPQAQAQAQQIPQANNVRQQNEQQPQPNPFLNLLNQTASMPHASTSNVPNQIINPTGSIPPFPFFPPFMAPFSIPPPPMPANLDQLTTEELSAMEGHERKHIEERLKLLKNVNTMINASIAMMNQYQTIVSNLPPAPVPPPTSTSEKKDESKVTSTSGEKIDTTKVKMEDLGSEEYLDHQTKPSTSSAMPTIETPVSSNSNQTSKESSSSTLIANEISSNGESEEANEIRKRRLQKFMQSN